jgi:hypothetical protein
MALLATLTACGGGDEHGEPAGDPTSLPHDKSSQATDDQTTGVLEQENPQRFIREWAAAEARMQNTGKTGPYVARSRDCVACRKLARTVAGYYAAGGFVHGGAWRIGSIKVAPSSNGIVLYTVHAQAAPMTVRESSSKPVQHVPARPVTYEIGLIAKGSSYTVATRSIG